MKKNNIKTKIIAGILSAITVCSVGSVAMTSASAAATTDAPVSSGIAVSIAKTVFGHVGKTLLNTTSNKLANMAIGPVFNGADAVRKRQQVSQRRDASAPIDRFQHQHNGVQKTDR